MNIEDKSLIKIKVNSNMKIFQPKWNLIMNIFTQILLCYLFYGI